MMSNIHKYRFRLVLILSFIATNSFAQCDLTLTNLTDSTRLCKNTSVQLNASVVSGGSIVPTDTVWTPSTGVSNIHVLNPVISVGTASQEYVLTLTAVTHSNFVDNGDFSSGNTGFTSDYSYVAPTFNALYPEGLYTITNNPNNVHDAFASFGDHTTGTGNMMVINGAITPVNIWCQTISVTPNTDYDFSAWGASATTNNPAVLQFDINGVLLGSSLQLPAINGQWTEFHVVWNSGANTSITICIYDQQTAAGGNDFAIDDISFKQICTVSDSTYLNVVDIEPSIGKVVTFGCTSDSVALTALNTGTIPTTYRWNFGDGSASDPSANPSHVYVAQGQYVVKLNESAYGCADSASTLIDTRHPLSVGFTADKDSICATQSISFTNGGDASSSTPTYFWSFGDGGTDNAGSPTYQFNTPGTYTVVHVITDTIPCSDTATMQVYVAQNPSLNVNVLNDNICEGGFISFNAQFFPGYDTATWNFGDGTYLYNATETRHSYDQPGTYNILVNVTYPECPSVSLTKSINVFGLPHVDLGPDTSMCPYSDPITISNHYFNNDPNTKYLWSNGDSAATMVVTQPGTYWLQATNPGGCVAADTITVLKSCYIDVPNAFTPNGDGVNDYFFPRQFLTSQLIKFHMEVFDRWGEKVFETDNLSGRGWDGNFNDKPQPSGVYLYTIDAQLNGYPEEKTQGNVTLIR